VGASTSHNPVGLRGLLQGYPLIFSWSSSTPFLQFSYRSQEADGAETELENSISTEHSYSYCELLGYDSLVYYVGIDVSEKHTAFTTKISVLKMETEQGSSSDKSELYSGAVGFESLLGHRLS
jgi:hypothetical protein